MSPLELRVCHFYVAKCKLGKVNLEAMLSGSLWMQETCLHPWPFTGTLCDVYMPQPSPTGYTKLGVAQAPHRLLVTFTSSLLLAIIHKAHFTSRFAHKLCNFRQPTLPWVGLEFCFGLVSPSVWWCPGVWWLLQGYPGYHLPCCTTPGSTNLKAPTPKLIY